MTQATTLVSCSRRWASPPRQRTVKDENAENLISSRERLAVFPGSWAYEETVLPQLVNAILSRHNLSPRTARAGEEPHLAQVVTPCSTKRSLCGSEVMTTFGRFRAATDRERATARDRGCRGSCASSKARERTDIADICDVDPIKAARGGTPDPTRLTMHFGLLPRERFRSRAARLGSGAGCGSSPARAVREMSCGARGSHDQLRRTVSFVAHDPGNSGEPFEEADEILAHSSLTVRWRAGLATPFCCSSKCRRLSHGRR